MTKAHAGSNQDSTQANDSGLEQVDGMEGGTAPPKAYSAQRNRGMMRQLEAVNAMILAKVASLSAEQQAQFQALVEHRNRVEANGHLDS
jgi:hypothetical protein